MKKLKTMMYKPYGSFVMALVTFISRKRYVVVLKLSRETVPVKIENARHYVGEMTGNPHFSSPHPALADVSQAATNLETAFGNAQTGDHNATQVMYDKRASLNNILTELGHYVEDIANDTPTPQDVITSAGMKFKIVHVRVPRNFSVKNGKVKGEVIAVTKSEKGKAAYIWQFRLTGSATWITAKINLVASFTFTGLTSGSTYEFRQQTITLQGDGNFTDELELVVL